MKTQERAYPDLVQATREVGRQRRATGEAAMDGEEVELGDDWLQEIDASGDVTAPSPAEVARLVETGGVVRASGGGGGDDDEVVDWSARRRVINTLKTAEINIDRDRRATLTSPIPAILAESMREGSDPDIALSSLRDPAAPEAERPEETRRLGDSDRQHLDRDHSAGYTVEVVNDGNAERRQRAARHIDQARKCFDAGDFAAAARAAEEALDEADRAAPPGIVEVIEPARPLLGRIFAAYVGPLTEVPVLARRSQEIAALKLDERARAVISRIDGVRTLDQIFDGSHIAAPDALRVAAALMRAGVIRVV